VWKRDKTILYLWCVINFLDQLEVLTDHVSSQTVGYLCRILYRSRQRGYLELDLLLGKWAENNAAHLNEKRLQDLVDLLEQENPDLWQWLTGQAEPPSDLVANTVSNLSFFS
jgi:succinate dehydrogenase flavin-adding protein (antitoxin of CptAB toxin-antitoxin module)